jgi:uracil phosphoribosyltransferase
MHFWDCIVVNLHDDPLLSYYASLELLLSHRALLLADNAVSLPQTLCSLAFTTRVEIDKAVSRAKCLLRSVTPLSLQAQLRAFSAAIVELDSPRFVALQNQPCAYVTVQEVLAHCFKRDAAASTPAPPASASSFQKLRALLTLSSPSATPSSSRKIFVLDCRPKSQFDVGHLPCAFHVSPDLLLQPAELAATVSKLHAMRGEACHFVFLDDGDSGSGGDDDGARDLHNRGGGGGGEDGSDSALGISGGAADWAMCHNMTNAATMFKIHLLQAGFKYLSVCVGGFATCHDVIARASNPYELIDHDAARCLECRRREMAALIATHGHKKKGAFGIGGKFSKGGRAAGGGSSKKSAARGGGGGGGVGVAAAAAVPSFALTSAAFSTATPASSDAAYKRTETPNSTVVTAATAERRLLHTLLRDTTVKGAAFVAASRRLVATALAAALERIKTRERAVMTATGGFYTGCEARQGVCTVAFSAAGAAALTHAVEPFVPVLMPVGQPVAAVNVTINDGNGGGGGDGDCGDVTLSFDNVPDDIAQRRLVILWPVLQPSDVPHLKEAIATLLRKGVLVDSVSVLCVCAARPALWLLSAAYPHVPICVTHVDEYNDKAGVLVPGVGDFDERSAV